MTDILKQFKQTILNGKTPADFSNLKPGVTIRVHQKIREEGDKSSGKAGKNRIQLFEGIIIARKHGSGPDATITVRKISHGVGVERIFPIYSTSVEKFEVVKASKVRRAKLYYLRDKTARETRKKTKIIATPKNSQDSSSEVATS